MGFWPPPTQTHMCSDEQWEMLGMSKFGGYELIPIDSDILEKFGLLIQGDRVLWRSPRHEMSAWVYGFASEESEGRYKRLGSEEPAGRYGPLDYRIPPAPPELECTHNIS